MIEEEVTEEEEHDSEYRKVIREIKGCLKYLYRLCDQVENENDMEKRDAIQQMNKINDTLQARLIEISFSP